jgi:hypothetical protein
MKTIVFIFVPVQVEKKENETLVRADMRTTLRKTRRILFSRDRHLQPFWSWFIDNPRPSSVDRQ